MTVAINSECKGGLTIDITGAASAAAAGLGSLANPEGVTLVITRATYVQLTAGLSTGAANLAIGITTAAAKATDILNDYDCHTAQAVVNGCTIQTTASTAMTAPALWTPTTYLTFTGSATTVGLSATLYLEYIRATAP
jgi:hypothetical protein